MKTIFDVKGMSCASCQAHVQKAVEKLNGIKSVNVNLLNNNMIVIFDETICNTLDICDAVKKAGYEACVHQDEKVIKNKKDISLIKLIISLSILLVIMYFSMGNMMWNWPSFSFFDHQNNPLGFALLQFILLIPIVILYFAYFKSGFSKLFKGHPNMDTLIAIGSTASIVYGIYSIFMIGFGHHEYAHYLYFESAAMILTLVSLGKYIEGLSKKQTTRAIEELIDLSPKTARLFKDGEEMIVNIKDVQVGDIVLVKKGDIIPVDGIIVSGSASIEEANITGESMPAYKEQGSIVYSSTILTSGFISVKATKVDEDTSIASIIKLVNEAANSKAPISRLVDKISALFVPLILIAALLTFTINFFVSSYNFELSFNFAITVVVIACPCALGLATPVAIMVGTGKGAKNGLLIHNAEILERTHNVKTIVLDKTGTITIGKPEVIDYLSFSDDITLKSAILSIESKSEHPLANAIVNYFKNEPVVDVKSFEALEGRGLKGQIGDETFYIGNERLILELKIDNQYLSLSEKFASEGKTPLFIIKNDVLCGIITLKDKVKKNSALAVKKLQEAGIKVIMLTGDNKLTATAIAKEIGITEVYSEVLPSDKQKIINSLRKDDKHLVAMVGDGVNDAIALTSADIGIALGAGSDVAINSADIVLLRNDLIDVNNAIMLSKRTLTTIKICLFWAFFYNFVCVIFATGFMYYINGFKINPMIGSIAMSISSVSVVLTALTINLFKPVRIKEEEKKMESLEKTLTISVQGMMCPHCVKHVQDACLKVNGVTSAIASLENNNVVVNYVGDVKKEELIKNIVEAGYEAK